MVRFQNWVTNMKVADNSELLFEGRMLPASLNFWCWYRRGKIYLFFFLSFIGKKGTQKKKKKWWPLDSLATKCFCKSQFHFLRQCTLVEIKIFFNIGKNIRLIVSNGLVKVKNSEHCTPVSIAWRSNLQSICLRWISCSVFNLVSATYKFLCFNFEFFCLNVYHRVLGHE